MLNEFYIQLKEAQTWFFGESLMADSFFSFFVDVFNTFILLVLFYALFMFPLRYCIKLFKRWINK